MRITTADQYISFLERHGYRLLGEGLYSSVYGKAGSDKVIKVGRSMDDWLDYILWATKAGYAGTFAPRVYSFRRFSTSKDRGYKDWYVAVMERLDCTISKRKDTEQHRSYEHLSSFIKYRRFEDGRACEQRMPGSQKFAIDLACEFSCFDLHNENFMLRFDGSLVCTDPISSSTSRGNGNTMRMRSRDLAALQACQL